MGQLVLLVVAAAWAAVLVPPLLRSRIENRPNSSVSDFRDQLSSLQRAMPSRGVAMRSMARPLAPSPLSRPAASGRPGLRSAGRTHSGAPVRAAAPQPAPRARRADAPHAYDTAPRPRSHAERATRSADSIRDAQKRRRANVLFVLALVAGCSLFLAATTKAQAMLVVSVLAFVALLGYVYVLGQRRDVEPAPRQARPVRQAPRQAPREPEARRHDAPRREARHYETRRHDVQPASARRQVSRQQANRRPADRWSHAV